MSNIKLSGAFGVLFGLLIGMGLGVVIVDDITDSSAVTNDPVKSYYNEYMRATALNDSLRTKIIRIRVDEWLRKNETRDEKRVRVLSEGTPVRFVVCPLCGLNRVLDKRGKGRVRWDAVDLDTALILQVRCGGGRGSGFYLDESRSLTLGEMSESPEYDAIVEEIRRQAQSILHALSSE